MNRPFVSSLHAPLSSTSFDYWRTLHEQKGWVLRLDTQDSSLFYSFFKAEAVGRNVDAVLLTVKFCDYSEMLSVR